MRDIRQDLQERLHSIGARRQKLLSDMKELDESARILQAALDAERLFTEPTAPKEERREPALPLSDFVVQNLRIRPMGKDEIAELAKQNGYFDPADSAGRAIHATVMNLERGGRIFMLPEDGRYAARAMIRRTRLDEAEELKAHEENGRGAFDATPAA